MLDTLVSWKPVEEVVEIVVSNGVTEQLIRRGYGFGLVMYRKYKRELETYVERGRPSDAGFSRLVLRVMDALEERGFLCIDSQAVTEMEGNFDLIGI